MADEPVEPDTVISLLSAAQLQTLLSGPPTIHGFPLGQTRAERAAIMKTIPTAGREAIQVALTDYILDELLGTEIRRDRGALYYMATEEETDAEGEWDVLQYSEDWRLVTFSSAAGTFYDFNGWPRDNEVGVGLFQAPGYGLRAIFDNDDQSLTAVWPIHAVAVGEYEVRRLV